MLLFVDESGHDHREMPYEVLAGVAITEESLWNLVRAIRSAEREHFGGYLRDLLRLNRMQQPARLDLRPYAAKLHDMQFHGQKPKPSGDGVWQLHGIVYLDDLRSQTDREQEEAES